MATKLTLMMDEKLIKEAKAYAKETQQSLSQLISDQLERVLRKNEDPKKPNENSMTFLLGLLEDMPEEFKNKSHKEHMYERVKEKHG